MDQTPPNDLQPQMLPTDPPKDEPISDTPKPLKYKNILCVEDEHFIGDLYGRSLVKAGYNIKIVEDGQEGLNEALTDAWDIILLDIMVPHINGIDILHKLRGPEATKQIKAKIIITTNLEQREEIREVIEKQADGYIIKAEITPKQLAEFLSTLE